LGATCRANSIVHLALTTLGTVAARALLGIAASLATNGFVLETLFGIELLLTSGKYEFAATITANESLVFEHFE
jgi:hypothetical protein